MKRLPATSILLLLVGCGLLDSSRFSAAHLEAVKKETQDVKAELRLCDNAAEAIRKEKHRQAVLAQEVADLSAEVARLEKSKKR